MKELLSIIGSQLTTIIELHIKAYFQETDFAIISERFANLRSLTLEIRNFHDSNSPIFLIFFEGLKNLAALSISCKWITSIVAFTSFPNTLKSFTLKNVTIEREEFASFLKANTNLEGLHLDDRVEINATQELNLKAFFEEFIRFSNSIKYFSFRSLYGSHIDHLNLIGGQTLECIKIDLTDLSLTFDQSFPTLTNVKTLCLHCNAIDDSDLSFFLSRLPNIEVLFISTDNGRFPKKTFKAISRLLRLKSLKFNVHGKIYHTWDIFKFANISKYFEINNYDFTEDESNALMNALEVIARNRKSDLIKVKIYYKLNLRRALPENLIIKFSKEFFSDDFL
ncbi:hypothetical protein B4U79_19009 [Dinothrombium tinctorium]|uniref:Uncharacterized protein n=1 Tax=Dinothrombium tinctorium TaxID=1965070 RepID=A0A3S3NR28_9ACAR|nr:hypothetical protein B4U79_19109 [Dinothrombium tinctorium]RWS04374.1 hypothetical protein B4U79_19101 [Dinothrombium tinctorium]RWS04401.1 hypothetical protein B4U79_19098 [Dinothrombium tinctorium]RWS09821.1 hypothetical protein B4U79_19009 [Dinothrombium tinctorium]